MAKSWNLLTRMRAVSIMGADRWFTSPDRTSAIRSSAVNGMVRIEIQHADPIDLDAETALCFVEELDFDVLRARRQ